MLLLFDSVCAVYCCSFLVCCLRFVLLRICFVVLCFYVCVCVCVCVCVLFFGLLYLFFVLSFFICLSLFAFIVLRFVLLLFDSVCAVFVYVLCLAVLKVVCLCYCCFCCFVVCVVFSFLHVVGETRKPYLRHALQPLQKLEKANPQKHKKNNWGLRPAVTDRLHRRFRRARAARDLPRSTRGGLRACRK